MDELIDNSAYKLQKKATDVKSAVKQYEQSTQPKTYTKIYLRVPDFNCREYFKAKNIVEIFDGDIKVIFYDSSTSKYVNFPMGVNVTEYILSELRSILGKENVVMK